MSTEVSEGNYAERQRDSCVQQSPEAIKELMLEAWDTVLRHDQWGQEQALLADASDLNLASEKLYFVPY